MGLAETQLASKAAFGPLLDGVTVFMNNTSLHSTCLFRMSTRLVQEKACHDQDTAKFISEYSRPHEGRGMTVWGQRRTG